MGAGALLTDLYQLTMSAAYVAEGMAERPASFSLFVRQLPRDRGYLVAAGLDDVLTWLEELRFEDAELAVLADLDLFDDPFLQWLRALRFSGTVRAVPEGTPVFTDEPILEVDAPLAMAQLVETYALNQVTLQTTLATKCARCRQAAGERAVVDFSLRRTQGTDAGMKLVRAARIAGLDGTSNVAGAARYGLRAAGTMAHSFVQAYAGADGGDGPGEREAFAAFARRYRDQTILLVDTYDTARGVERAIDVAREMREEGVEIRGVRLDSGDLVALAERTRRALDDAGFPDMQVFVSGGLDEYEIDRLLGAGAPIDGFGVGTAMGVSRDAPSLDSVYKLVEYDGEPVRKTSEGKRTWPGRKQVWRRDDGDLLGVHGEDHPGDPLLVEVMQGGERSDAAAGATDLDAAAQRCAAGLSALPEAVRRLRDPGTYPVEVSDRLRALAGE